MYLPNPMQRKVSSLLAENRGNWEGKKQNEKNIGRMKCEGHGTYANTRYH